MNKKCRALRTDGQKCRAWPKKHSDYCNVHHSILVSSPERSMNDAQPSRNRIVSMLHYGTNVIKLVDRLSNLKNLDPERYDRLYGICARLDFKERIRYSMRIGSPKDIWAHLQYQRDRLVAYLATTCIDAAAGDPPFSPFPQWFIARLKAFRSDAHTQALVQDLVSADSEVTVVNILRRALATGGQPQTLADQYYNEEGVARPFKKVLHNLDPWLKHWLAESYFIAQKDIVMPDSAEHWLRLDTDGKFRRVVNYLFSEIRNVYTHTVEDRPSREHIMGSHRKTINGVGYYFKPIFDRENKLVMDVGLRQDYVESEVIQLLVVAYLRKCWLHMEDDQSLLGAYWEAMKYRRSRFLMVRELRSNLALIERWHTAQNSLDTRASLTKAPLAKISTEDTRSFKMLHESRNGGSLSIYVNLRTYLRCAQRVDQRIEDFNESIENVSRDEAMKFVNELTQLRDVSQLLWFLEDAVHHLVDQNLYY